MLSYQHRYHAGGPSDVHKHSVLWLVLRHLAAKEKPFCALDLHAGEAVYRLTSADAAKTGEHLQGVAKIWREPSEPEDIAGYLDVLREANRDGRLDHYPGSPAIIRAALRADDRLIVNELHPAAAATLSRWAQGDRRIACHRRDAVEALGALLPPQPRRGLVLVDPSYEDKADYEATAAGLLKGAHKWPQGIFLVWYPLLPTEPHQALLSALVDSLALPALISELQFDMPGLPDAPHRGLRGSGLLMINPPWQLDAALADVGRWLVRVLGEGARAGHELRWLIGRH
jgi:23S rRNA (adenine2030-N6)-methyltransferase